MQDYITKSASLGSFGYPQSNDHKTFNSKDIYQVWLVSPSGYVLLREEGRDTANNRLPLDIEELTIESYNIKDLKREIKKQWSIDCDMNDLETAYSYEKLDINTMSDTRVKGFILYKNFKEDEIKNLTENKNAQFVDYRELEDHIHIDKKPAELYESFYSLLSFLDKRFHFNFNIVH